MPNTIPEDNDDDFVSGDLPSVTPPLPEGAGEGEGGTVISKVTHQSDATLLKLQEDSPAGTHAVIRKAIAEIEGYILQRKAINASIKAVFNKLKEHKIDAGPVKFVIKQRALELEYRNAFDMTVRLVRNALGEAQLWLLGDDKKDPDSNVEPLPEKAKKSKGKILGAATGNPEAKKAALAKGKGRAVKLSQFASRAH
jgi:uncharacterized protein (UPF0335 family)